MSAAISESKARRMRDVATKRRMFSSLDKAKGDQNIKEEIATMISHVRDLTFAVQTLIGFASPFFCVPWTENSNLEPNTDSENCAKVAHQWNTAADSFQPRDTVGRVLQELEPVSGFGREQDACLYSKSCLLEYRQSDHASTWEQHEGCHWITVSCYSLDDAGSHFTSSTSSSGADDYDVSCTTCGHIFSNPLNGGEYDGDRCDKCACAQCANCMHTRHDLKGEWLLCSRCFQTQSSTVGDFRALPNSFWETLYQKFADARTGERDSSSRAERSSSNPGDFRALPNSVWETLYQKFADARTGESDSSSRAERSSSNPLKILDSRLNYILLFLEGHHEKSNSISENARPVVLQCVKQAMEWNRRPRSPAEIQAKVEELDRLMSAVVKQNQ